MEVAQSGAQAGRRCGGWGTQVLGPRSQAGEVTEGVGFWGELAWGLWDGPLQLGEI